MSDSNTITVNLYDAQVTALIGPPPRLDQPNRTYVITGNGRGGTTMVAGVAQRLGLELSAGAPRNMEDPFFATQAQGYNPERGHWGEKLAISKAEIINRLKETCARRNEEFPIWGWKDPNVSQYLNDISAAIRNLQLIIVFRDPVAVTTALMAANHIAPETAIDSVMTQFATLLRLAKQLNCPTLLVSYERARLAPNRLAAELADFLGFTISEHTIQEIAAYVSPSGGYQVEKIAEASEVARDVALARETQALITARQAVAERDRAQAEANSIYAALQRVQAESAYNYAELQRVQSEAVHNYEQLEQVQGQASYNYAELVRVQGEAQHNYNELQRVLAEFADYRSLVASTIESPVVEPPVVERQTDVATKTDAPTETDDPN